MSVLRNLQVYRKTYHRLILDNGDLERRKSGRRDIPVETSLQILRSGLSSGDADRWKCPSSGLTRNGRGKTGGGLGDKHDD